VTTDDIIVKVNEAYRKGYLDGMNDRKPVETPAFSMPDSLPDMNEMALKLQNLMGFDGSPQPPIGRTV
jgi:hypothetical protein